ncbi:hypothetical protein CRE_31276 [Caenorhabditis remanei]|uniref:Serpentine receptor class gamma n=1 Tax=Caenorhabditis remanei TaxID=31234 RepID=E3MLL1_CAERE|nr:hypothetical protein CRE_31276 [Caenorhabditis remanei]
MDLLQNPRFVITTTYGIVGMLLYTWVSVAILINRHILKSSFFKLFVISYVINDVIYANSFITLRLPQSTGINGTLAEFFKNHDSCSEKAQYQINISHTLHYQFAYIQYIFNFYLCLHRFIAIYFPLAKSKVCIAAAWIIVLLSFILPFLDTKRILSNCSYYQYSEKNDSFCIVSTIERKELYTWLTPLLICITVMNIILNTLSFLKMNRIVGNRQNMPKSNLLKLTICIAMIDAFLAILGFLNAYIVTENASENHILMAYWISVLTPFASDALTLSPPILLLTFSRSIRRSCIDMIPFLRRFNRHSWFASPGSIMFAARYNNRVENLQN